MADTHAHTATALTEAYRQRLADLVARAQARTITRLRQDLDLDDQGRILITPRNQVVLRRVDRMFLEELDRAGYPQLEAGFVGSFPGQLPVLRETLALVGVSAPLRYPRAATREFAGEQMRAKGALRAAVEQAAVGARQNALAQVGLVPVADLAEAIARATQKSVPQSEAMAVTALSSYYRLISARAYAQLEDAGGGPMLYRYSGPLDKLNRPWCRRMMLDANAGRTYTRAQIRAMQSPTMPGADCFLVCGGWRCRHHWDLAGKV